MKSNSPDQPPGAEGAGSYLPEDRLVLPTVRQPGQEIDTDQIIATAVGFFERLNEKRAPSNPLRKVEDGFLDREAVTEMERHLGAALTGQGEGNQLLETGDDTDSFSGLTAGGDSSQVVDYNEVFHIRCLSAYIQDGELGIHYSVGLFEVQSAQSFDEPTWIIPDQRSIDEPQNYGEPYHLNTPALVMAEFLDGEYDLGPFLTPASLDELVALATHDFSMLPRALLRRLKGVAIGVAERGQIISEEALSADDVTLCTPYSTEQPYGIFHLKLEPLGDFFVKLAYHQPTGTIITSVILAEEENSD